MIAKGCPKCEQQVPVACKACPCGHSFFKAKKLNQKIESEPEGDDIRRRTQRVRREKPNYYDALEYDKRVKRTKTQNSECDEDDSGRNHLSKPKRKKVKKEEDDDEDIMSTLTPEKQIQCTMILEELNRKMQIVTWKPQ